MAFFYKKQKHVFIEVEVNILHPVMRALTNSFTNSNPLQIKLSEVTRVLYCQKSIFIIVKNDYSKPVESNLLLCVQIRSECEEFYSRFSGVGANTKGKVQSVSHTACLGMIYN